jgi:hypothetical protein
MEAQENHTTPAERKGTKKVSFPDGTEFPIKAIFDVGEGYTQVLYFDENLPQILWVPNEFVNTTE